MNLSSESSESESDNIWNLKTKLLELFDLAPNKVYFSPNLKKKNSQEITTFSSNSLTKLPQIGALKKKPYFVRAKTQSWHFWS